MISIDEYELADLKLKDFGFEEPQIDMEVFRCANCLETFVLSSDYDSGLVKEHPCCEGCQMIMMDNR